jgi:hypothetical protein
MSGTVFCLKPFGFHTDNPNLFRFTYQIVGVNVTSVLTVPLALTLLATLLLV